jgi:hypothetical protein
MINEKIGVSGVYTIKANGEEIKKIDNRVMDAVLNKLAEVFRATAPDLEIKYLAVGDDDTAVTNTDVKLGNETFRTAVSTEATTGTGIVEHTFIILDSEAVGSIKEIGIFGGVSASATTDSGTLISRVLWDYTKASTVELNIIYTNSITRA